MCGHRNERDSGRCCDRNTRRADLDRRGDGRGDRRRGPELHRRVHRAHGPGHRQRRRTGAGRLPRTGDGAQRRRRRARRSGRRWRVPTSWAGARRAAAARWTRLLAAYRVGARVAWRHMSASAVRAGLTVEQLARFAELVFAYIDQLSASSVAGHSDELATTGRVRERYLERLAATLLAGAPEPDLTAAAERAGWAPPRTLTAVVLPEEQGARRAGLAGRAHPAVHRGRARRRRPGRPARAGRRRPVAAGAAALAGRAATPSSDRPGRGRRLPESYARACRALQLGLAPDGSAPLDTDDRLADLVLRADDGALADLRARALAPLADLSAGRPREADRDAALAGCCTTAAGRRSPRSCSSTRRPCGTG